MASLSTSSASFNPANLPTVASDGTSSSTPAPEPTGLVFQIGEERLVVQTDDLADSNGVAALALRLGQACEVVVSNWNIVLEMVDQSLQNVMSLAKELGPRLRVRGDDGAIRAVFEATLELHFAATDFVSIGRWRQLLVEMAATFHADAVESVAGVIRQAFVDRGLAAPLPQVLQREIRNLSPRGEVSGATSARAIADAFLESQRPTTGTCVGNVELGSDAALPLLRFFRGDFYLYTGTNYARVNAAHQRARLVNFLQSACSNVELSENAVRNVLLHLEGIGHVDNWDADPPFWFGWETERRRLIACSNGFVDVDELLASGVPTLHEHDPRLFNTTALPYRFDPAARCPLWLQTLSEIFPSEGSGDHRIAVLQEFCGLTLLEGKKDFDEIMILAGKGENGKTTVLQVWTDMLGEANVSNVPIEALGSQFRSISLLGKKANIAPDMSRPEKLDEGKLKALSSGERQQFDQKHKAPIDAASTASMIFGTNEIPKFSDRTNGMWRRLLIILFLQRFDGARRDRRRARNLRAELSGILNWAIAGLIRLMRQQAFTSCDICAAAVAEHRLACMPVRQFIEDEVRLGPDFSICRAVVYTAYVDFCRANGRPPINSWDFGKDFLSLLPAVISDRSPRQDRDGKRPPIYRGVTLYGQPLRFEPIRPRRVRGNHSAAVSR